MLSISLRQYEYVIAVADAGSMTEAANAVNVSQPSLSVAIKDVEGKMGRKIFLRRKGSATTLTPFGHRFVEQARGVLYAATEIERESDTARPFVLGCFEDLAPWYLTKTLARLSERFPTTEFRAYEGRFTQLATEMNEGRVDLAITYDIGFDRSFGRRKIKQVSPVVFVAVDHPLATQSAVDLRRLNDCPLILSAEELSFGYIRNLLAELGVKPDVRHKTSSLEMMRSLAASGVGVGISYSNPPTQICYDGQPLVTIPITTVEARADVMLVWANPTEADPFILEAVEAIASA